MFGLEGHYAVAVADHFDADFRIMAQSGWGVHCSCFNDFIHIMPKYYEQICGVVTGETNRRLGAFAEKESGGQLFLPQLFPIFFGNNSLKSGKPELTRYHKFIKSLAGVKREVPMQKSVPSVCRIALAPARDFLE